MKSHLINISETQAVRLLLVRAVEEQQPGLVAPDLLSGAALAALHTESDGELLERRANYLIDHLPRSLTALERMGLLYEYWIVPLLLLTFCLGAAANYLEPSGQVHVGYNPIVVLLLWNLGVYVTSPWIKGGSTVSDRALPRSSPRPVQSPRARRAAVDGPMTRGPVSWLVQAFLRDLFCWWHSWRARSRDTIDIWKSVVFFSKAYAEVAGPLMAARLRYLLHLAAIGAALGAVVGVYLRGLFLDYHAVWKSTFLHDPEMIAAMLNGIVGLASFLIDGRLLSASDVYPLLQSGGMPAAPWIHRLALTVLVVVIMPRALLMLIFARRAQKSAANFQIDLSEPYFVRTIETARQETIHRMRGEFTRLVSLEIGKLAESTALFVRENLFDKRITPLLLSFRNNGGRVGDLEAEIARQGSRFEVELKTHLEESEMGFCQALATGVNNIIGQQLSELPHAPILTIHQSARQVGDRLAGSVAASVSDWIGTTATAAVAAGIGTISGGIGQTLGVAIISTLLGTSGPIGLLIGGITALAVAGGAYMVGRERFTATVKRWTIPPPLAKIALREAKIDNARLEVYGKVRAAVEEQLESHTAQINRQVFRAVSDATTARR